jgi:hypothetical protein
MKGKFYSSVGIGNTHTFAQEEKRMDAARSGMLHSLKIFATLS